MGKPILIGITGAIGSGKSTLAKALATHEPGSSLYETFQLVAEIGDAFNQALKAELAFATARNDTELINQALIWLPDAINEKLNHDVSWSQLAIKRHSTLVHPALYRRLFLYLKQVHTTPKILDKPITASNKTTYRLLLQWLGAYLVAKARRTIWYDELLRRINKKDAKKKLVIVCGVRYPTDAFLIRKAGGKVIGVRRPGILPKVTDVTEVRRHLIKPDCVVVNNGKLKDLTKVAAALWHDITANGGLKHRYAAVKATHLKILRNDRVQG